MPQSPNETPPNPAAHDAEQKEGKVVRLIPRRRPAPEKNPEPQAPGDGNDPGPSAA
jgi:hypothetical protein